MIDCRYVSSDSCEIGLREYDAIGQRATFSEEGYREVVLGRGAFIPEAEFQKLKFTPLELEKFGPAGSRPRELPAEFLEKLYRGQQAFRDIRDRMLGGSSVLVEVSDLEVGA